MNKKYLILLLWPILGFSQKLQHNQANWFAYMGTYNVSPKWAYHIEAQFRLNDELSRANQNLFRFGGVYNFTPKLTARVGYGLINTLQPSLDNYFHEDRIWEDLQYNHPWNSGKNMFSSRLRLEQRFVDRIARLDDGSVGRIATHYQNRFRYMGKLTFHLANFKSGNEELYAVAQDEVFLNLGNNEVNSHFLDQNRLMLGVGFNYKNSIRFEVTYLNQFSNPEVGNSSMNHIFSLCLFQNLILYRQKQ